MKVYITMSSVQDWAMVNSLWASIRMRGFVPDRVHLFASDHSGSQTQAAKESFELLLSEYGKTPEVRVVEVPEDDFVAIGRQIERTVITERQAGNEICMDITTGRKAMVAAALAAGLHSQVQHIHYLYIASTRGADRPYMKLPLNMQRSMDFAEEMASARKR